jgi:hypothetical protein
MKQTEWCLTSKIQTVAFTRVNYLNIYIGGTRCSVVLAEALWYKSQGNGFDSRLDHLIF